MTGRPDGQWVVAWMTQTHHLLEAHRIELNERDAAIGDGDHGDNMCRGWSQIVTDLVPQPLISDALIQVAQILMHAVGGASGPLFATAFLRASHAVQVPELEPSHVVDIIDAMTEAVSSRGKTVPGDKTMLDALCAAQIAVHKARTGSSDVLTLWQAAAAGALKGARATEDMIARRGRAGYFGTHSRSHGDPGAYSMSLVISAAAAALTTQGGSHA